MRINHHYSLDPQLSLNCVRMRTAPIYFKQLVTKHAIDSIVQIITAAANVHFSTNTAHFLTEEAIRKIYL
ncbi:hypothetical protein CS542_00865 [Pedobacter sp. IW39]|nr:hypothetical protein CS542_00865 [Pedobacter sp. IW39]